MGVDCTYSKGETLTALDKSKAVDIDELTEEETNTIVSKLLANEAFVAIMNDLGLTGADKTTATDYE